MMGDEATKWFLRHHFRNHGLTVLRYFLKRGFIETLVKAYNICVTMVAQGHRHQLSIPPQYATPNFDQVRPKINSKQNSRMPKDFIV